MNKVIRTFFFFTKWERIGVLVLLSFLVTFLLAPYVFPYFKTEEVADFSTFDEAVALLESSNQEVQNNSFTNDDRQELSEAQRFVFDPNTISKDSLVLLGLTPKMANTVANFRNKNGKFYQPEDFKKTYGLLPELYLELKPYIHITKFGQPKAMYASNNITTKKEERTVQLFSFDPNTVDENALAQLGFSQKVIRTFVKFRSKGGKFYKKEDVKKIYGLSETQYQQLAPYIDIPKKEMAFNSFNNTPTSYDNSTKRLETKPAVNLKKSIEIDVNKAAAEEWQQLRGIGPAYAKRITNFRDKLGGFLNIQQVAETYGIPDSTFQMIQPYLTISAQLRKIPINSCEAKDLSAHPYIKYQVANAIIAYRKQHGSFASLDDLKKIILLDEETFDKISPYLEVD